MASTRLQVRHPALGLLDRWPLDLFPGLRWPDAWFGPDEAAPMRVEEYVEDGRCVVRAELPGIDPEKDIEIDVAEGALRIRAERRQEFKAEEKGFYRSEIRYGVFSRTIPLPPGVTEKDVSAAYKDGILEVRLPLPERKQPSAKRIPVKHG